LHLFLLLDKLCSMKKKLRVGILFGGQSAEHEISLLSAKSVYDAIDKKKYDVCLIGIDKKGQWHLGNETNFLSHPDDPKKVALNLLTKEATLLPYAADKQLVHTDSVENGEHLDVLFPLLHGPNGEDGTVQGLLKLAHIPFVGADVIGSAIAMDKDVTKRLLRDANIPTAKFIALKKIDQDSISFKKIVKSLGLPFFVKPANLGSSVAVSKVKNEEQFKKAVQDAFSYDNKILIEEYIQGKELWCSVLGNEKPIASLIGEIVPEHEFFDYAAKYYDDSDTLYHFPVPFPQPLLQQMQDLAIKTVQTLCCEGMARVDFFLDEKNNIFINEINTIPGFRETSLYPKLWKASGISYIELIDRLIMLAVERHTRDSQLKTTYA